MPVLYPHIVISYSASLAKGRVKQEIVEFSSAGKRTILTVYITALTLGVSVENHFPSGWTEGSLWSVTDLARGKQTQRSVRRVEEARV